MSDRRTAEDPARSTTPPRPARPHPVGHAVVHPGARRAPTLAVAAVVAVIVTLVGVLGSLPGASAVGAQQESPTATSDGPPAPRDVDDPTGNILPRPNSGAAPQGPGDRGGWLQLSLLGLLVLFPAVAFWRIRAERARSAVHDTEISTPGS